MAMHATTLALLSARTARASHFLLALPVTFVCIAVLVLLPTAAAAPPESAEQVRDGLSAQDWSQIQHHIELHGYAPAAAREGGFHARNRSQGLALRYASDGTTWLAPISAPAAAPRWQLGLRLVGVGYDDPGTSAFRPP